MTYVMSFIVHKTVQESEGMQKMKPYTIDLTKINGNGRVSCPKCGVEISPDDTSEDVYTIIEPVVREDRLEKIVLQCNNCRSQISLEGFSTLSRMAARRN